MLYLSIKTYIRQKNIIKNARLLQDYLKIWLKETLM